MQKLTLGQLLIEQALPEDMRGQKRILNKKGTQALFQELAEKHPDQYREVAHKLMQIGDSAGTASGGYSFGLRDLLPSKTAQISRIRIQRQIDSVLQDPRLTPQDKEKEIIKITGGARKAMMEGTMEESLAEGNPLALQAESGSKGNPSNLLSLRGGDLLYTDHKDRTIPLPVLRSYSEGLTPAQVLAGAYGARKGTIDLKIATQDVGYYGKQLGRAAHRLVVTDIDSKEPHDESTPRGLPVDTVDPDNEGAVLAKKVGPYNRNTILTPKILMDLKNRGHEEILVRSPMIGGPEDGGVYSYDLGVREKGRLSPIGDFAGISAAAAISEPLTQSAISSKHLGGVAGTTKSVSGFKLINQITQSPKTFPGGAVHSQADGKVDSVEKAPQGGHYVDIAGIQHYIPIDRDLKIKKGDNIESGDVLSSGIPNPGEVVERKGIGEGRRQFVKQFIEAAKDAGFNPHRRNVELVTRGLINHVRLHREMGDYNPEDVIPYSTLEHIYKPRDGYQELNLNQSVGKYLEKPVLHHSIGTKIRPSMLDELKRHGVRSLFVHNEPPEFEPTMIRGQDSLIADEDWMTRMLGANLEKYLLKGVHRGDISNASGTSYVPALAEGLHFGRQGKTKGWEPNTLKDMPAPNKLDSKVLSNA